MFYYYLYKKVIYCYLTLHLEIIIIHKQHANDIVHTRSGLSSEIIFQPFLQELQEFD